MVLTGTLRLLIALHVCWAAEIREDMQRVVESSSAPPALVGQWVLNEGMGAFMAPVDAAHGSSVLSCAWRGVWKGRGCLYSVRCVGCR